MINLDVSVEAGGWPKEEELRSKVDRVLTETISEAELQLPDGCEAGIIFADDKHLQKLNSTWREQDKPTNVLSFAANDGVPRSKWSPLLGDIVLARETLEREAIEQDKSFEDHLTHLVIHGFLHLVGYDHLKADQAAVMESTEARILRRLGIADPYAAQ